MVRSKVKRNKIRLGSSPKTEPNFYSMPPVGPSSTKSRSKHAVSRQAASSQLALSQAHLPLYPVAQATATTVASENDAKVAGVQAFSASLPTATIGFPSAVPPPLMLVSMPTLNAGLVQHQEKAVKELYHQLFPPPSANITSDQGSVPFTNDDAQAPFASAAPDGMDVLVNRSQQEENETTTDSPPTMKPPGRSHSSHENQPSPKYTAEIADMARFLRDVDLENSSTGKERKQSTSDDSMRQSSEGSSAFKSLLESSDELSKQRETSDESRTQGTTKPVCGM